ncbi:MAG: tetratricopeptide repeat protein, partial [Chloroflexales bacterium]|nr:tetratricopeptide repeat protein [Chloroflexales bacterium]
CAIARWFDASVLRVLREKEEGNEHFLDKLRDYSFVRDLGDGRLAYHDEVRQALLEEWKRDRPDEARAIHRRLYSYFSTRTTPPGSLGRAMPLMPDSSALSVVPMSAQADLLRRESLYHLLHIDLERGLAELRRSFAQLEEAHRLADAELLIQTASETPLGPRERRWVQYLRARVLQAALRLDDALSQLNALRALGDLEPDLGAEVSRTLGEVYSETGLWARATELYLQSLGHFARTNNRRAVAETMLLLGEAYQGLGVSTGSWYAPAVPTNPLLRAAQGLWVWLIGLPFQIAILLMGKSRLLPQPEHCARYQNWLLIRLYNTARTWYVRARDAFRHLEDAPGLLKAEQRLADILLLYGYHEEARAAITGLLRRPEARDPYRRAWLQRSLAECLLAAGEHEAAQSLLGEARAVFKELGDVRREASVLTLQGRAAAQAGDVESALRDYQAGLARFRALRYAAARERILHELRTWQRRPEMDALTRGRVAALVAAEPEKRYVGRFIRSYQGLLQIT